MKQKLRRVLACLTLCALLTAGAPATAAGYCADVPEDYWAAEDIQRCVELGYFSLESGYFGVGTEMTRAEFVMVLCRFFDWDTSVPSRSVYEDVPTDASYAKSIYAAYRQGAIILGGGSFFPERLITRGEVAAMLVRALGYDAIAGLTQDLPLPFQDVQSNLGYITMAYGMGLMNGTTASTFSPEDTVTREQLAVILMRIYDKFRSTASGRAGIASSAENLADLRGYDIVAIPASYLVYNGAPHLTAGMETEEVEAIRSAAREAGTKVLLHVAGGSYQLRENSEEMAAVLLEGVREGSYDGLFLDISGLTTNTQRKALTATAEVLRKELGTKLLYIVVEAPSWRGAISGYDYAALGELADRIVLRLDTTAETDGGIPVAPQEPLEEIYYALNRLRGLVDAEKLSILTSSTGSLWINGINAGSITGSEIAELLEDRNTQTHYSGRYAGAYLTAEEGTSSIVAWYLNGQSIQDRTRLAKLFSVGHLCLSELSGVLPDVLEAMP